LSRFIARAERYRFERAMAAEEKSSSRGRPELDLGDDESAERENDGAPVAGGLCRLDAPDAAPAEEAG
jgi:hypothetical protein